MLSGKNIAENLRILKLNINKEKNNMRILRKTYSMISYIIERVIKKLLLFVEFFLFLRLLLKFLSASPQALVVGLIYEWSDILVSPFVFIFPDIYWPEGYFIDSSTVSAMFGYWIAVYIIFQLLQLFSRD